LDCPDDAEMLGRGAAINRLLDSKGEFVFAAVRGRMVSPISVHLPLVPPKLPVREASPAELRKFDVVDPLTSSDRLTSHFAFVGMRDGVCVSTRSGRKPGLF
jgi:hypothetical protein